MLLNVTNQRFETTANDRGFFVFFDVPCDDWDEGATKFFESGNVTAFVERNRKLKK
jgi:hypothetical protein